MKRGKKRRAEGLYNSSKNFLPNPNCIIGRDKGHDICMVGRGNKGDPQCEGVNKEICKKKRNEDIVEINA